jgi:hypothetical protein
MSFGTPLVGTVYQGAGPATPSYPAGLAASNAIFCVVLGKPITANQATAPTMPAGWTLAQDNTDKGGSGATVGVDNGNLSVWVYRKDTVTGSETGTISITAGFVGAWIAAIIAVPSTGGVASVATAVAEDTTNGDLSLVFGSDPGVVAGDLAVTIFAANSDGPTFSAWAYSQTGISAWGTIGSLVDQGTTAANDARLVVVSSLATSGTSSSAPTVTATVGGVTVARGPGIFLRLREASGGTTINAGRADETDSALAVSGHKSQATGVAGETDAAIGLSGTKRGNVAMALETSQALAPSGAKVAAAARADETSASLALSGGKSTAPGLSTETNAASSLTGARHLAPGVAAEADVALALAGFKSTHVGRSEEVDAAFSLFDSTIYRPIERSDEADIAVALGGAKYLSVGAAIEICGALALSGQKSGAAGRADEINVALALAADTGTDAIVRLTWFHVPGSSIELAEHTPGRSATYTWSPTQ